MGKTLKTENRYRLQSNARRFLRTVTGRGFHFLCIFNFCAKLSKLYIYLTFVLNSFKTKQNNEKRNED